MKFGEMLIEEGTITRDSLQRALERQVVFGGRIGTNLVELGILKEEELTHHLSKYLRIKPVDVKMLNDIPADAIESINADIANEYKIIPFRREKKRLHVAMADVRNITMVDELRFKTGYDVVPYVVSEIRLLYALEKYYGVKRDLRYISVFDGLLEDEERHDDSIEIKKVKESFLRAKNKGEVAGIVINETRKVASRAALFFVKGNRLEGWVAKGIGINGFSMEIGSACVVSEVLRRQKYYRGTIEENAGNIALISLVGGIPRDCLIMPVGIRERIVAILYADNGIDKVLSANLNYANTLVSLASLALEILILKKKIIDL